MVALWVITVWLVLSTFLVLAIGTLFAVIGWAFVVGDAPWVPQTPRGIGAILRLLGKLSSGTVIVDFGSGDGRVLRAIVAQHPTVRAVGIDQSRILTAIARLWSLRYRGTIRYLRGNFLTFPLGDVDVVTCYLWPRIMPTLGEKFQRELRPGARIISAGFTIPGWKPTNVAATPNTVTCYEYRIGTSEPRA